MLKHNFDRIRNGAFQVGVVIVGVGVVNLIYGPASIPVVPAAWSFDFIFGGGKLNSYVAILVGIVLIWLSSLERPSPESLANTSPSPKSSSPEKES